MKRLTINDINVYLTGQIDQRRKELQKQRENTDGHDYLSGVIASLIQTKDWLLDGLDEVAA